jgi:hypothetical protein
MEVRNMFKNIIIFPQKLRLLRDILRKVDKPLIWIRGRPDRFMDSESVLILITIVAALYFKATLVVPGEAERAVRQ